MLFIIGSPSANASVPQLTSSPSSLRFGDLDVGQSETLMVNVTNAGTTSVTVTEITVNNPVFAVSNQSLPLTVPAGQSFDVSVSFTPAATGWTGGTIRFSSNASNPALVVNLGGTGVGSESATASPAMLSFGQVMIGASAALPVVITNARSWKVTITAVQSTGAAFSVSGPTFPVTLSAGQSVALSVAFKPQSAGTAGGSLFVYGPALNVPLTGTGAAAGQLIIAPAPLNFGDVAVGSSGMQSLTLTASGSSVTVSSVASSGSQFVLEGGYFPVTIPSGGSASFNVAFTPQAGGAESGSLSFSSNASNSTAIEPLLGTGTVTYSVNLWWNSTSDVAGYNVYRSMNATGPYSKLNSALEPSTAYTDSTVAAGNTYYYAATSVNSSGQESARSTPPVTAVVP
ncbi:MAG: choice-of-anchor D domain-containing protein [Candidatus Sulfotelmatobacter sp.]